MRDPVFTGKDVAEAVQVASRTLAVSQAALRYVVLDQGQPGGRGLSATEARIAVLIETRGSESGVPAPDAREGSSGPSRERSGRRRVEQPGPEGAEDDPSMNLRRGVEELARAAGVELAVEVSEVRDAIEVRLEGSGTSIFFDQGGEALAAFEHWVERVYGKTAGVRRVRVSCAGYRQYRDGWLHEQALALAEQVRADGEARTTQPLNSYERRVIHLALENSAGVTTFSVGEGHGRRVTVAPSEGPAAAGSPSVEQKEPMGDGVAAEKSEPAAESVAAQGGAEVAFDYRAFDRPPERGSSSELM